MNEEIALRKLLIGNIVTELGNSGVIAYKIIKCDGETI
jgi:hypothetical protein